MTRTITHVTTATAHIAFPWQESFADQLREIRAQLPGVSINEIEDVWHEDVSDKPRVTFGPVGQEFMSTNVACQLFVDGKATRQYLVKDLQGRYHIAYNWGYGLSRNALYARHSNVKAILKMWLMDYDYRAAA